MNRAVQYKLIYFGILILIMAGLVVVAFVYEQPLLTIGLVILLFSSRSHSVLFLEGFFPGPRTAGTWTRGRVGSRSSNCFFPNWIKNQSWQI